MREDQSPLYNLARGLYQKVQGFLDSDADVSIIPVELGFSVCFRHDMDRFTEDNFDAFLRVEDGIEASATLFFLESQFTRFADRIRQLDTRYECALHSECGPTPFGWSLFQLSRLIERGYGRRLRRQGRRFGRRVGPSLGHAAHSVNNYLPFQGWINWNIIENASLRARFAYISDWRLPSRVAEGEDFFPPWPAYIRRRGDAEILVLPTSWDDKFFFYSYEDLRIRGLASEEVAYRTCSAEEAWVSVQRQAERCRRLNTPFILNLHPWHAACNGQSQFYQLKKRIADWCATEQIPLLRCRDYLEGAGKRARREG